MSDLKVTIVIIKEIDSIGSFDTSKYKVGQNYQVGERLAEVLVREGYAQYIINGCV